MSGVSSRSPSNQSFFSKIFRRPSLSLQTSISSSYSNSSFASCALTPNDPSLVNPAQTPQPIPDIGKYLLSQQSSTSSTSQHPFPGPHSASPIPFRRRLSGFSSACSSAHGSLSSDPRSAASRQSSSSSRFRFGSAASDFRSSCSGNEHISLSQQASSISTRSNLRTPCRDLKSAFSSQSSLHSPGSVSYFKLDHESIYSMQCFRRAESIERKDRLYSDQLDLFSQVQANVRGKCLEADRLNPQRTLNVMLQHTGLTK